MVTTALADQGEENSWFAEGDVTVSITGGSVDLRRFYTVPCLRSFATQVPLLFNHT